MCNSAQFYNEQGQLAAQSTHPQPPALTNAANVFLHNYVQQHITWDKLLHNTETSD